MALALIGSLDPTKPLPGISDIQNAVIGLPASFIRDTLLSSLTEAGNELDKLRTSIATWFDDSMERLSGAYKRQLKWISMLIGLIVTIAFNADSFNVATTLWSDQDRRASVVAIATKVAKESPSKTPDYVDETKLRDEIKKTENTLRSLPIGWNCVVKPYDLHLMSVAAPVGIVNEGRNLVIVALVGTDLHIRIFDGCGKKVVDKAENELASGETLTALRRS